LFCTNVSSILLLHYFRIITQAPSVTVIFGHRYRCHAVVVALLAIPQGYVVSVLRCRQHTWSITMDLKSTPQTPLQAKHFQPLTKIIQKFPSKIACQAPKPFNHQKTKDIPIALELFPTRYN
jgi:hypothetical protein